MCYMYQWRNYQLYTNSYVCMCVCVRASVCARMCVCVCTARVSVRCCHSLLTAIHSFRSSPSGNWTACLMLPDPSVREAYFISSCWWDPSGIFLCLTVLLDGRPLETHTKNMYINIYKTYNSEEAIVLPLQCAGISDKRRLHMSPVLTSQGENSWRCWIKMAGSCSL